MRADVGAGRYVRDTTQSDVHDSTCAALPGKNLPACATEVAFGAMHDERRRHARHRVCFPIRVDGDRKHDRVGMSRDGSASGILFGTPSHFDLGDRLVVSFQVSREHDPVRLAGRVVRVGIDGSHRDSWCSRLVALEFERAHPELEDYLAREAPRHAIYFDPAPNTDSSAGLTSTRA
jgi:hypothetical protein